MYSCYFCKKCYENNRDTAFVRGDENPIDTDNCKFDGCKYEIEQLHMMNILHYGLSQKTTI